MKLLLIKKKLALNFSNKTIKTTKFIKKIIYRFHVKKIFLKIVNKKKIHNKC